MNIGGIELNPYISISYEYNQASNGQILGGQKKISLTESIVADTSGSLLTIAKSITDFFAQTGDRYLTNITIDGTTYDYVIVDNVSVTSEDWVNYLDYTIDLIVPLSDASSLPSNALSVEYNDFITSLSITESMEIQSDKHNTYYLSGNNIETIGSSLTWNIKIDLTCRRTLTDSAIKNAHNALNKILITIPDRQEFNEYKTWTMYLQNRTLDTNPVNGSLSFSCKAFLVPSSIPYSALLDMQISQNHNYATNSHNLSMNLKCTGLAEISWVNIIDTGTTYTLNKIQNAKNLLDALLAFYKNSNNTSSEFFDLILSVQSCAQTYCNLINNTLCYSPKSINTTKNITEGIMSASIEWTSDINACDNGISIEIEKTIQEYNQSIVENSNFWIVEPIITNINCSSAYIESYSIRVSSKYNCLNDDLRTKAWNAYALILPEYNPDYWVLTKKNLQQTNNNCTLSLDFVQKCQIPIGP